MKVDGRAPRGGSVDDRIRRLVFTADTIEDQKKLALLNAGMVGGEVIVKLRPTKEEAAEAAAVLAGEVM